ncbi:hypothetical protein CU097_011421 [Rhizopus azygosporus]|uniref:ER-bound oxygenase mpaB/mpaB'/Rubber oxygenase catalytic domain-containing protein n=1 Tax=Rhizopus azygosporus TaxID=86630 RepID=A0A367K527_RHIAZ|nr:hypothetical protein CU097_011421 [Rhizopus azygosporus]
MSYCFQPVFRLYSYLSNARLTTTAIILSVLTYLIVVRRLRYKNLNLIRKRYPSPDQVLVDPAAAQFIYTITACKEFPYLFEKALELALFKTYIVPSISKLLVATKQFSQDPGRRAEDTALLLAEVVNAFGRIDAKLSVCPDTSLSEIQRQWDRAREALDRINEIHGRYNISNGDYLYTLALFIVEPVEWINKYEWRKLDEREINAIFKVWYDVGVSMNIKDIPSNFKEMQDFYEHYAEENVRNASTNWAVAAPTLQYLLNGLPICIANRLLKGVIYFLPSVLHPRDAAALNLPVENKTCTRILETSLFTRAFFIRHCMLPRQRLVLRTSFDVNQEGKNVPGYFANGVYIYKKGYRISELGPSDHSRKASGRCPFS